MKYASIGSISHGTLRTEDLVGTFASELDMLVKRNYEELDKPTIFKYAALIGAAEIITENPESSVAYDIVNEFYDALNEFALPYCYFGANEGDGSDLGFWPCIDQISELPKISDPAEAGTLGEDCVFVNDHGNMTVYAADGSVTWDCV